MRIFQIGLTELASLGDATPKSEFELANKFTAYGCTYSSYKIFL